MLNEMEKCLFLTLFNEVFLTALAM